jgi:hypothetical protein
MQIGANHKPTNGDGNRPAIFVQADKLRDGNALYDEEKMYQSKFL